MPFKHNAARRHRIPRARYRVTNWRVYEAGLRRRGDLALWLDEAALASWAAPKRSTPGGQPLYADLAIELMLTLRLVFHLALRQAEAFTRSVLKLLGLDLRVPDHSTLSRRGRAFAGRQPRCHASGPVHLMLDSTGLELFGQGEWDAAKHGRARRRWMKLHLAVDADSGEIAAHMLTDGHADDAAQVPDLLRQPEGTIASVIADGAYDGEPVYQAAAARQPSRPPDVIIPPRASAVPSTADPDKQSLRDRHIRLMAERGRMGWQRATGYGRRNLAETAIGRYKHLIGPKLRARTDGGQQAEVALAVQVLNRMIREAKPVTIRRQ
jgi:hypothetical protein